MNKATFYLIIILLVVFQSLPAIAQNTEIQELRQQVQQLMQRIDQLENQQQASDEKITEKVKEMNAAEQEAKAEEDKKLAEAIQLYGQLRLSVDNNSSDFGEGKEGTSIKSNASRLGVKGTMPSVLQKTAIIYKAEIRYGAADEKDAEIEWREGFAGLKGNWGKVRLGRLSVPYKATLTTIDPWNDNIAQSRGFGGRQGSSALHSSYFNNAADYVSPSFYGLAGSVWTATQFDGETNEIHNAGPINKFEGGDAAGLGIHFKKGPWFLATDYVDIDADNVASGGMDNGYGWQVGARYSAKKWSIAVFYEDVEELGLGNNIYLNGIYKIGKTRLIATYGQNRDATQYAEEDIDTWSLGAKYALGKSTELFAVYNSRDEGDLNYNTVSSGLNVKFGY